MPLLAPDRAFDEDDVVLALVQKVSIPDGHQAELSLKKEDWFFLQVMVWQLSKGESSGDVGMSDESYKYWKSEAE